MSQLYFYVSDEIEKKIRAKATQANLPLSKYLAELVNRETSSQNQWPEGYFDHFDDWEGEFLSKPDELPLEKRLSIK